MKFTSLKQKDRKVLHIPIADKGMNLTKPTLHLEKDEIGLAKNIFYENGLLKTRNGIYTNENRILDNSVIENAETYKVNLTDAEYIYNGKSMRIATIEALCDCDYFVLLFLLGEGENIIYLGGKNFPRFSADIFYIPHNITFFVGKAVEGIGIFAFVTMKDMNSDDTYYRIFEIGEEKDCWCPITNGYTPTVYINGRGNAYEEAKALNKVSEAKPQVLESLNMLYGRFYAYFSSDGFSHSFRLPFNNLTNTAIQCVIHTSPTSSKTWVVNPDQKSSTITFENREVTFTVDRATGTFNFISEDGYYPIALMSNYSEKSSAVYNGHLTGNKSNELIKTIDNYTVTLKNNSGLFNILGEKAVVENVTVAGSIYGNNPSMGVVANYNYGTIRKANSQAVSINSTGGKVNDYSTLSLGGVGGVVGTNYGLIEDCTVSSVRDNVIQGKIGVGGIAGINYGKITNMRVDAIIGAYNGNEISKTINNSFAGCVVGVNFGEVSYIDVYNGKVNTRRLDDGLEGEGATNIGGVVGYNAVDGLVSNCMFDGMRCVGDTNVGGIVGYNDGTVENCYTGRRLRKPSNTVIEERQFISPVIGSYNVGGIVGKCGTNSVVRNVFSTANVWAYRNQGYTVAERADNAIGVQYNQNPRTSSNYLGLKYGVPYSNELIAPSGINTLVIDNSEMIGLSISYGLGFELNEEGVLVANMQNVKTYLEILGAGFGFRNSSAHGIRLLWESSVVPLNELVIPEE